MPFIVWNKKRLIEDWKTEPKDDFFGSCRQALESSMNFYNSKLVYKQAYPKNVLQSKDKTYKHIKKNTVEPLVSEHPKCKD